MYKLLIRKSFFLAIILSLISSAQNDPFYGNYDLASTNEVLFFYPPSIASSNNRQEFRIQIYDWAESAPGFTPTGAETHLPASYSYNSDSYFSVYSPAVFACDLNGDEFMDIAAAWVGPDSTIIIGVIPHDSAQTSNAADHYINTEIVLNSQVFSNEMQTEIPGESCIRLTGGNLDDDDQDEIVLMYYDNNNDIKIAVYDADGTLTLTQTAASVLINSHWSVNSGGFPNFVLIDAALGDFDNDGVNEIAATSSNPGSGTAEKIAVQIYDYNYSGATPLLEGRIADPSDPDGNETYMISDDHITRLFIAAADMNYTSGADQVIDELVICYNAAESDFSGWTKYSILNNTLYGFNTSDNTLDKLEDEIVFLGGACINAMECEDLNNDGRDEMIVARDDYLDVATNTDPGTGYFFNLDHNSGVLDDLDYEEFSNNFMTIADINGEVSLAAEDARGDKEIIILYHTRNSDIPPYSTSTLVSKSFHVSSDAAGINILERSHQTHQVTSSNYALSGVCIAAGDFKGDNIRFGIPEVYQRPGILQPLIIINAPPMHFDMLSSTKYDISNLETCKGDIFRDCPFRTVFTEIVETEIQIEATFKKDWGISSELKAGGSPLGGGVSASLKTTYGENFSKTSGSSNTVKAESEIYAVDDDMIYASVVDYTIYEYPVYGKNIDSGYVIVFDFDPTKVERRWMQSRDPILDQYRPDHEPGNILSYKTTDDFNALMGEIDSISVNYSGDTYGLGALSSYTWALNFTEVDYNSVTTSKDLSISAGVGASYYGVELNVSGSYSQSEIATHSLTLTQSLDLSVHLGGLNTSLGEVQYAVTPFAYWDNNGLLKIDYVTDPSVSQSSPTWWQTHYSTNPDPAFILPWLYSEAKGDSLQDDTKKWQTKEILLEPQYPVANDTIKTTVRIQNYSLVGTSSPVTVKFYHGDPDAGGIPLTGVDGSSTVTTEAAIPARGQTSVTFTWVAPADLTDWGRLYAVIDPENFITEVKEENNKGWVKVDRQPPSVINDRVIETVIPESFSLMQNYPNPFNPVTTIEYTLPYESIVRLEIYSITGEKVATLFNGTSMPGKFQATWDASKYASGMYIYRIQAVPLNGKSPFIKAGKMLLLK